MRMRKASWPKARAARFGALGLDEGRARVADAADALEPRDLAVVEAAGLRGRRRRRQPGLAEEAEAGLQEVGGRRRVERDADPGRGLGRLEAVDHHPVEEHPRPVGGRAVEPDDPALDVGRHLVRRGPGRRRGGCGAPRGRSRGRGGRARGRGRARSGRRAGRCRGDEEQRRGEGGEHPRRRLGGKGEVDADAERRAAPATRGRGAGAAPRPARPCGGACAAAARLAMRAPTSLVLPCGWL